MAPLRGLLDSELERVRDSVVQMASMAEKAVLDSIEALVDQDTELAEQVVENDDDINRLRFAIEDACFTLLATQQPTAIDLRTVVTALNIITDLERIGDYAKGIGQIAVRVEGADLAIPPEVTSSMARAVCDMMRAAVGAFVEGDVEAAQQVAERDDTVDRMYRELFESVIQAMISREQGVRAGMHLLFAAHNLERVGDRVTNIGERVIFMQTGLMHELNW